MESDIQPCIDVLLTEEEEEAARSLSYAHNPANRPSALELGAVNEWLWKPGETLRVSFLGGEPALHERIKPYVHQWSRYANIRFEFLPDVPGQFPEAPIRVAFVPDGTSWSLIGTQALKVDGPAEPTMNLGWLTPTSDEVPLRRVVLHEFGHALGCIHEHLHPKEGIPWNRAAVYAYYATKGWTKADVDANLFNKYAESMINGSAYDPQSIMHYPIDAALRLDHKSVPWNTELSAMDKAHIAALYPRA